MVDLVAAVFRCIEDPEENECYTGYIENKNVFWRVFGRNADSTAAGELHFAKGHPHWDRWANSLCVVVRYDMLRQDEIDIIPALDALVSVFQMRAS